MQMIATAAKREKCQLVMRTLHRVTLAIATTWLRFMADTMTFVTAEIDPVSLPDHGIAIE
jgi:hypothetical protein